MDKPLLDLAQEILGWPRREDLFRPSGAAKSVMAKAAAQKIGHSVSRLSEAAQAHVGILTVNPSSDSTEPPLALVCEFPRPVGQTVLREAQRLAWNFSLSPLLITVEPHIIRGFTCCEQTLDEGSPDHYEVAKAIPREDLSLANEAARAFHWVNLVSGEFYQANEERFRRDQRADQRLLDNLIFVRDKLLFGNTPGLNEDVCHDLLARVIFIQFLMDRKDEAGKSALDPSRLRELCGYSSFGQVLRDKESTYALFNYLNQRFNGDLFSADNGVPQDAEQRLNRERQVVDQAHLDLMADLVDGILEMKKGQLCLWKQYAFDVIPLEFISSIYEEFVSKKTKTEAPHYTPQHLVDFVLDGVLPWNGDSWDLKILDPACGSGVFLVKAFQRLVYRWRAAHEWQQPSPNVLRQLLEKNIFGIDINAQAVKVASFSLYLAMCEHIEPVDLWQKTSFPKLRGQRIVSSDFFSEDAPGFRTREDAGSYDLVIGNPPWGKGSTTELARKWAKREDWITSNKDIGPMFLPKAAALAKQRGSVSLIQPAKPLLFNRGAPARRFSSRLFETFKVEEVINLAAVRFHHFDTSDSPVCIISFRPAPPDGEALTYICPKPSETAYDKNLIIIDPQDVNSVSPQETAKDQAVWTALMWGGRRDLSLLISLKSFRRLMDYVNSGQLFARGRVIRGKQKGQVQTEILDRRILTSEKQIENCLFHIDANTLPLNKDTSTHRRFTDMLAFNIPQLILKQSWTVRDNRFRALMVNPDASGLGIVTTLSYVSVHGSQELEPVLETACMIYNSIFAVYYLLLTSGRFAVERPTILDQETLSVPLPELGSDLLKGLNSLGDVDSTVRSLFAFSEVEWALIEDMTKYTVPSAKSKVSYPYDPTSREKTGYSEMRLYGEFFLKVLKAGFGQDKRITCVPFVEAPNQERLPVRLVAFYLESPLETEYQAEEIDSEGLYRRLAQLHTNLMNPGAMNSEGILFHRIARIYDVIDVNGQEVPVVYIIKPDKVRYWTRSMALRDADEVAADIMSWVSNHSRTGKDKEGTFESTTYPL